ncbi:restriction endonuclease [Streptomyces sp. NPDC058330]|uniref:restriction endonuclease n=1 Tax=Streptomyces sp. NPDC058330 TaxID=3346449 RepID=UPI0036E9FB86
MSLLPDGMHVTTSMVATCFEMAETVIRAVVFDTEYTARARPVDNSVHNLPADLLTAPAAGLDNRIDQRVTHILGTTVAPHRAVDDGEMREFVGTKALHRADVAVYVATRPFSREAHDIAAQAGATAVHRGLLEAWSAGTVLQALR